MSRFRLLSYLDDARGVVYANGYLLVWFGGVTVNVVDPETGDAVDAWSLEADENGAPRDHQVAMEEMRDWVSQETREVEEETCDGNHTKGDGSWWAKDARGIELCRVCDLCEEDKLSRYRPEILTGYTQADVDEPIEPDDGMSDYEERMHERRQMGLDDF